VICRDLVIGRGWRGGGSCPLGGRRDLLNWVSCVYPPLGGLLFLAGNPYMILYVYITIIYGRNKYRKISKSRQMRLASQGMQGIYLGSVKGA
jgi:hypothetical protein